jgi:4-amino-4-deoxy-L-arabinose transferase-like glycosyltransferase
MRVGNSWKKLASSDLAVLVLLATAGVLLHTITNGQYGLHHDELATLDDARSLAWGYVAYPPLTPFLARIAFILFGPSLFGLRFFAAVALGVVLVLTGLMARHLGGGRQAQIVAALAAAIGGVAFSAGSLFQYVSFDYGVGPTVVSPAAISQLQALFLVPVLEFSPFSNSQKCVHAMCV